MVNNDLPNAFQILGSDTHYREWKGREGKEGKERKGNGMEGKGRKGKESNLHQNTLKLVQTFIRDGR